ncbi:neuronal acetylcholine receptor subunit alpha-9-like, partial [Saccoglossus kowalevskii]
VLCTDDHKRLFMELFETRDYYRYIRPVYNTSTTITVEMQFFVAQVLDMDERKETLQTNAWLTLRWKDEFLTWDPGDYNNIEFMKVSSSLVWIPDIYLYGNAATKYENQWANEIVSIKYNGTVMWAAPEIIKTHCTLDVTRFPFDDQQCTVMFGPWQHTATEITVVGKTEPSYFNGNAEWSLTNIAATDYISDYRIYPDDPVLPYSSVEYIIVLRRQPLYYIFNLILPCGFISATTLLSFFLPADSGEKVGLGITVLLSLTVFLLLVAEILPPASTVPVIGQYYAATMVLVSLSLLMTVIVLNLHHRGPESKEVPKWIRKWILGYAARFLLLRKATSEETKAMIPTTTSGDKSTDPLIKTISSLHDLGYSRSYKRIERNTSNSTNSSKSERRRNHNHRDKSGSHITVNVSEEHLKVLKQLHKELKYISDHYRNSETEIRKHSEWKQVAMVVDRCFMVGYIIGSLATCLIIICQVFIS